MPGEATPQTATETGPSTPSAPGLTRSLAETFLTSGATIVLTAFAGVLGARVLGAYGRGEFSAVSSWLLTMSWVGALGFSEAMTYLQSRNPERGPQILATTLVSVVFLGAFAILVTEVLLPYGFAAQTNETLWTARLFAFSLPVMIGFNSVCALLSGHQRFRVLNLARLGQPLIYAVALTVLWLIDGGFTVSAALVMMMISYGVVMLLAIGYLVAVVGLGRPSWDLTRTALWFGLRLQGHSLGAVGNTRLDITLLPGFVAATPLGYYAIAVSVASMASVLFGQLTVVLYPAASRAGRGEGPALVERAMRMVMIAAVLTAAVLGAVSPFLLPFVYGHDFEGSVGPLLILLPGIVLWSGATILASGLQAVNRPGRASIAQLIGLVVTVVGLVITLPRMGIYGAAWTSTVAYATTFVAALAFLRQEEGFSVRQMMNVRLAVVELRSFLQRLAQGRRPGPASVDGLPDSAESAAVQARASSVDG